ncbi:MAG: toll/interleukin-1 receptor domain-containing protein [Blastocatellia bacterium]
MQEERIIYDYDVFISYRRVCPDQEWVREQLVPRLEAAGLKVWFDKRDATLARGIYADMDAAIEKSRRAICVITPAYKKGIQKKGGLLSYELQRLQRCNLPLIPLLLRGQSLPEKIDERIGVDWKDPAERSQQWEKLLNTLEAINRQVAPPGKIKLCWRRILTMTVVVLLVVGAIALAGQLGLHREASPSQGQSIDDSIKQSEPRPSPGLPRLTIQQINGRDVGPGMLVPLAGKISGKVEGEFARGSSVFIYMQRSSKEAAEPWMLVDSIPLNGPLNGSNWSSRDVAFRLPLTSKEMTAEIQVLLGSRAPGDVLQDSELSQATSEAISTAPRLTVRVPDPGVEIREIRLDRELGFVASGTVQNILGSGEKLYLFIEVTHSPELRFNQSCPVQITKEGWSATCPVTGKVQSGDQYTVEVVLVAPEFESQDGFRPEHALILGRKKGRA